MEKQSLKIIENFKIGKIGRKRRKLTRIMKKDCQKYQKLDKNLKKKWNKNYKKTIKNYGKMQKIWSKLTNIM